MLQHMYSEDAVPKRAVERSFASKTLMQGFQIYPNPVSDNQTRVSFLLNDESAFQIDIYDILGRSLKTQLCGFMSKGYQEVSVDVTGFRSGQYILRVRTGYSTSAERFCVVR